ncbi:MAG: isoaspartyl peptidase/L-asparaginase [Thermoanaerobaculia bacterium]|nr:isoaspartyl peptidase/L-asparaginase [Thermoanaerobaculia bacterium]
MTFRPRPTFPALAVSFLGTLLVLACTKPSSDPPAVESVEPTAIVAEWALAIHGGAGTIDRDTDAETRSAYIAALSEALSHGKAQLESGASALDVVEEVVRILEDAPQFNAGKGAVFNAAGKNELDAAIMDGRDLSCGAVAGLRTVRNPITLARHVMTDTGHVLLMGDGAEAFADEVGVERADDEYFYTEHRWQQWQKKLANDDQGKMGTVGAVARDKNGDLAAATSTGGLTGKKWGRVGDVPVIGAGTFADNRTVAVSGTGKGEEFIRHSVANSVSTLVAYEGLGVEEAANRVVHGVLAEGDGGLIAVGHDGAIALVFNSQGMFRGAADSNGRFDVAIWEEEYPGEAANSGQVDE